MKKVTKKELVERANEHELAIFQIRKALEQSGIKWTEEPKIDDGDTRWSSSNTVPMKIGDNYDTTNWQNSLIERESVELTGSDLCRARLERGDSRVVCLVSDVSDDEARDKREITSLIEGFSLRSGFYTERSEDWVYAVPVNVATNEPLTASEAGL